MTKIFPILLLTVFFLIFFATEVQADKVINFGVYTSDKPSQMVRKFLPAMNYLEQKLSEKMEEKITIRIQVAKNYKQGVDDLISGKVDFSRFGPASYISAKAKNDKISILAMESKKGKKQFYGVIATAAKSSINKVEDLKGKSFAFGSQQSTIGRYLSQQYLYEKGVTALTLKRYEYLGRHDKVAMAVAQKHYDAGAFKESTYKKMKSKGVSLKVIARFPNVTKPWISSSQMDTKMRTYLKEILLTIKDKDILKALSKDGFLEADDSDYDVIRLAISNNQLFFE